MSPKIENFLVKITGAGRYPAGSVVPRYVIEAAAGNADAETRARVVAEMVERGTIVPTSLPVNVDIAPPIPRGVAPVGGISDQAAEELNRLRKDLGAAVSDRDAHASRAAEAVTRRDALAAELAKYVEANGHLTKIVADHEATIARLETKVEELESVLDDATAPTA